jgi:hypothetical protein
MGDLRYPRFLQVLGCVFVGIGVWEAIYNGIARTGTFHPLDAGVLIGGVAITAVGVVAIATAANLKRLEARLNQALGDKK